MPLSQEHRLELLTLARESIAGSLAQGIRSSFPTRQFHTSLKVLRSSFVTLRIGGDLRGCCGSIDAPRLLVEDVWFNAWASAFSDPRFSPLASDEWPNVDIHVSVLETPQPLLVATEEELLAQLRPQEDGLILELGAARATFLPSVWQGLPQPQTFVRHLKLKAGWPAHFWSSEIRVWRYGAESFGET